MGIVTVVSGTKAKPSLDGEKPILGGADEAPERNVFTGLLCADLDRAQREAAAARKSEQSVVITASEFKIGVCGYQLPPQAE